MTEYFIEEIEAFSKEIVDLSIEILDFKFYNVIKINRKISWKVRCSKLFYSFTVLKFYTKFNEQNQRSFGRKRNKTNLVVRETRKEFQYGKFDFLYLVDSADNTNNLSKLNNKNKEFFNG